MENVNKSLTNSSLYGCITENPSLSIRRRYEDQCGNLSVSSHNFSIFIKSTSSYITEARERIFFLFPFRHRDLNTIFFFVVCDVLRQMKTKRERKRVEYNKLC